MGIEINIPNISRYGAEFGYLNYSKFSQSFVGGFNLSSIGCHFSAGAGSPGTITMNIYLGAYPSGGSLGSATSDGNTVTAIYPNSNYRTFTFSPVIVLAPATTYCFSLELSNENYDTNYLINHQTSTSSYGGGQVYWYDDVTPEWVSKSTYDIISVIRSLSAPESWDDGGGDEADTYNVYIGPSGDLSLVSENQVETSYITNINEVPANQKIYWRVDAINDGGSTTGDEWNFDARPGKATNPLPPNEAVDVTLDQDVISWDAGAVATSYDVYYGETDDLSLLSGEYGDVSYVISGIDYGSPFDYDIERSWRINSVNQFGITVGDVWIFSTIKFDPPSPIYWYPNFYYYLYPEGTPPPDGEEGVDYEKIDGPNVILNIRRLVAAANNKIWYEDI